MRWLFLAVAVLGVLLGFAFPKNITLAGTGKYYSAMMTPPSGTSGQSPVLTCGWHTGACDSRYESGISLDWDDTPTTIDVYFRGYFTQSNSPSETTRLKGKPVENQKGSSVCDIMDVWIIENYNGQLRAVPRYYHMNLSTTAQFSITTSGSGTYNNRKIGYMVDDAGCTGQWKHVHEEHVPDEMWDSTPNVAESINTTRYPSGDYCLWDGNPSDCVAYQNNVGTNWTRTFTWEEGS